MNDRPKEFDDRFLGIMPELRRYARRMTDTASEADEALGDAMEAILKNWRSFREDGSFSRWCKLTIRSKADWNRRVARRYTNVDVDDLELSEAARQEDVAEVYLTLRNVAALPEGGREIVLSALGHSQIAVGKMVGVTGPRVCQRLKTARADLRAATLGAAA